MTTSKVTAAILGAILATAFLAAVTPISVQADKEHNNGNGNDDNNVGTHDSNSDGQKLTGDFRPNDNPDRGAVVGKSVTVAEDGPCTQKIIITPSGRDNSDFSDCED